MYHIAICDDDKIFIAYIKNIINQVMGNKSEYLWVDVKSGLKLSKMGH